MGWTICINVDNDGDGIPDGFWMDIGLPIQTDAGGRRFKPLPIGALVPNRQGQTRAQLIQTYLGQRNDPVVPGIVANYRSTNESYDAFDFQNMFLGGYDSFTGVPIPSFYRPSLPPAGWERALHC